MQEKTYTFNSVNNPHPEIAEVERVVKAHIGWAVDNKNKTSLYSTMIRNEEFFMIQPDSKGTVAGFDGLADLVENVFMTDEFRAIRAEVTRMRIHISPSLQTAWYSCILNDYNEFRGEPFIWENVRWTGILEKVDGTWKIFQMHFSKAEDIT